MAKKSTKKRRVGTKKVSKRASKKRPPSGRSGARARKTSKTAAKGGSARKRRAPRAPRPPQSFRDLDDLIGRYITTLGGSAETPVFAAMGAVQKPTKEEVVARLRQMQHEIALFCDDPPTYSLPRG